MPSSRARLRVCGIDDVVLRLREGERDGSTGSFWSLYRSRVEISLNEPGFHWMREHGTLHIPDVRAQNDFPTLGRRQPVAHLLGRSTSSARGTHWKTDRASHRGASLHPGADQAASKPSRTRPSSQSRTCGCLTNSRSRWSSRRRRVKFSVSSLARRRTFSPCLTRLPRARRGCAGPTTRRFACSMGMRRSWRRTSDRYLPARRGGGACNGAWLAMRLCSSAGQFTFQTFRRKQRDFRTAHTWGAVFEPCSSRRCFARARLSG